jgi:FkbM family methyltransferase
MDQTGANQSLPLTSPLSRRADKKIEARHKCLAWRGPVGKSEQLTGLRLRVSVERFSVLRGPFKSQALQMLRDRGVVFGSVLDVGVLNGTPELVAAFPDLPHVLFEPVIEFTPDIEQKYADIDYRLVHAAVSDREGETALSVFSVLPGMPISHAGIVADDSDASSVRRVPVITLDGYLAREPSPGPYFLKIDVDGFEMQIMRGATETLANTSVVMIETPEGQMVERIAYLQQQGFRLLDLVEPAYYAGWFWQCDALMIRESVFCAHFEQFSTAGVELKHRLFDETLLREVERLTAERDAAQAALAEQRQKFDRFIAELRQSYARLTAKG